MDIWELDLGVELVSDLDFGTAQVLDVPGGGGPVEARSYTVRAGDTVCGIAQRFDVSCQSLLRANRLGQRSVIVPGQQLRVPAGQGSFTAAGANSRPVDSHAARAPATAGEDEDLNDVLDRAVDLGMRHEGGDTGSRYYIVVEPDETLGHYADWLRIPGTGALRKLNRLDSDAGLRIGQRLRLPVSDAGTRVTFERRRQEYHRVLVEEFKERYSIDAIEPYTVSSGDSPWHISKRFQVPLWVLIRFNPQLRASAPSRGDQITIPVVRNRG